MFWNKKIKRVDLSSRTPKKRKSFFEKKEETGASPIVSKALFRIILLFFIVAVAYILFFSTFVEVKKVYLEGISELNYGEIQQKISGILNEKYFRIISKNNIVIFPKKELKSELTNSFRKINSIKIERVFPDAVRVVITERKSLLVWCSGDSCYIVDDNGYAYAEADFESEEIKQNNLVRLNDISAKPVNMGENILDKEYIQYVTTLGSAIEEKTGIKISGDYQTQSRVAEEVRVRTDGGWEIYFSTSLPMEESIGTLQTFLEKEISQDKRSSLEYIDLRAENKVYYKFRDEEQNNTEEIQNAAENPVQQKDIKKNNKEKK